MKVKRKLLVLVILGIISIGTLGCSNKSEEVVLADDVIVEEITNEDNITIEKIEGLENKRLNVLMSENNKFYAMELYDTGGTPLADKDTKLYELSDDNKFMEVKGRKHNSKSIFGGFSKGIVFLENIDKTGFSSIGCQKSVKDDAIELFKLDNEVKISDESTVFVRTGMFNEELGFYNIFNNEGAQRFKDDPKLNKTEVFEVINIKNNERFEVENNLKEQVLLGFEHEGLNILTTDYKIYKLKKEANKYKVELNIDLLSEFGINIEELMGSNDIEIDGDEIIMSGTKYSKALTTDDGKPEEVKKLVDVSEGFLGRYNMRTKEKHIMELGNEAAGSVMQYFKGNILLTKTIIQDDMTGKSEYYIGKLNDDKIKLLKKIDIDSEDMSFCGIISSVSNDEGDELLVEVVKSTGAQAVGSDTFEYYKINID